MTLNEYPGYNNDSNDRLSLNKNKTHLDSEDKYLPVA